MPYVSITGLKLKRLWHAPVFWHHATRSMAQALSAEGCRAAHTKTIRGVHHTKSLWDSRSDMIRYLRSGAHKEAMRSYPRFATGKVLGFEAEALPDWEEVHHLWRTQGRDV